MEVGEQIVGSYLKAIKECDLVEYNIPLRDAPGKGEIDVVGINLKQKIVYLCEVTTHTGGLMYVNAKTRTPDNVERIQKKFEKNVAYAKQYFSGFKQIFMFWTPIVKLTRESSKYQPTKDLEQIRADLKKRFGIDLQLIYNEEYLTRFQELKDYATRTSEMSKDLPIRMLQIQGYLERHCERISKTC